MPAPRLKPQPLFAQAAIVSIERCALFIFRYLDFKVYDQLQKAIHAARYDLKISRQHTNPLFDCRDWPEDKEAGEALEKLLTRLDTMERPRTFE